MPSLSIEGANISRICKNSSEKSRFRPKESVAIIKELVMFPFELDFIRNMCWICYWWICLALLRYAFEDIESDWRSA